jgi:PAS domain S-box-containing protein
LAGSSLSKSIALKKPVDLTGFFFTNHTHCLFNLCQTIRMGTLSRLLPSAIRRWILTSLSDGSEDKFSRAFHASPDWIVITRLRDGLIVEANLGFQTISGYSPSEVIGQPMSTFDVWVQPEQRNALVQELLATGAFRDTLVPLRRRDGSIRDCLVNATLIALEDDKPSHAVWIARDVTEARKAAEALRESEARFSRLFEQSPLPMCFASDQNAFATTHWNRAWFDVFGFAPDTDQGKTGLALNIWVNPTDREHLLGMMARGETSSDVLVQMRRANGELRWMQAATRVITEAARTLYVSTYVDVTDQIRSQQEVLELNSELELRVADRTCELQAANGELLRTLETLRLAKDQLVQSEKLAALGALVAGVAHELNTPIGNGLTMATTLEHKVKEFDQLLAQGLKRSDLHHFLGDLRLATDILVRNLVRAGDLVSSFKQVAVDQTSTHRRRFLLASFTSELLITLGPTIRKSHCTVTADFADELWMDSYPGPIGQVLTNLINNAIVHGFDMGASGLITVRAQAQGPDRLLVEVHDNGLGIHPDNIHRVFEPFFTTRLGQGGSGLGLHIVHNLVTGVLGGSIDVHSHPERGTTFSLLLPTVAPAQTDAAKLTSAQN